MATIKLTGKLDLELTRLGLKEGDIICNATYSYANKGMYFNVHHVITNECVVYPENYEILIKDITGNDIMVTDIKAATEQCLFCLDSPFKMVSGHTVGENHCFMLEQLELLKQQNHE